MSASPSGKPAAASVFSGSAGVNFSLLLGKQRARYCDDGLIGLDRALGRLDAQALRAMVDPLHGAIEHDRQIGAVGGYRRTVAFNDAPVYAAVVVSVKIFNRLTVQLDAADVGTDGIDQVVPAAIRLEQRRSRRVGLILAATLESGKKCSQCFAEILLFGTRKSDLKRRPHPGRRRFVDRAALRLRKLAPRVAVGGMQPPAAEVDGEARTIDDSPRPAAEPRPRFDHKALNSGLAKPSAGGNAGRAAADDRDLDSAVRHCEFLYLTKRSPSKAMATLNGRWADGRRVRWWSVCRSDKAW